MRVVCRRRVLRRVAASIVALACGGAAPPGGAAGDAGLAAFRERVDVDVVDVEVAVTDEEGRPVRDLGRDELELRVDGRPVELAYFAPPVGRAPAGELTVDAAGVPPASPAASGSDGGGAAPPPAARSEPAPPFVALYVDQTAIRPGERREALRGIRAFLDGLPVAARVLVATFDGRLALLAGPTSDRVAVESALAAIERTVPRRLESLDDELRLADSLDIAPALPGESQRQPGEATGPSGGTGGPPQGSLPLDTGGVAQSLAARVHLQAQEDILVQRAALDGLRDLLAMLAGVEGRRLLLLTSGGFVTRPAARLADIWEVRMGRLGAEPTTAGTALDAGAQALRRTFEALVREAQAAGVTVVAVDAAAGAARQIDAERLSGGPSAESAAGDLADLETRGNLRILAEATGGRSLRVSPRLGAALGELAEQLAATYSLGFAAPRDDGGAAHRIEVRATRPGLVVRHREGYRLRRADERAGDAAVAAAALGGAEDPLGIAVEAGAPFTVRGAPRVPVTVRVPLRSLALLPEGDHQRVRVALHLALRDERQRVLRLEPRSLALAIPNSELAAALRRPVELAVELPLARGSWRLAVTVEDELAATRGTVVVPLELRGRR